MASASQTALSFRHIFGVNANVSDNISFTDDDTCVYVAGEFFLQKFTVHRSFFAFNRSSNSSIQQSGQKAAFYSGQRDHRYYHCFRFRMWKKVIEI